MSGRLGSADSESPPCPEPGLPIPLDTASNIPFAASATTAALITEIAAVPSDSDLSKMSASISMQSAMPKLKSLVGIFFSSGASLMSWVTTEVATVAPELVSNEFHVKNSCNFTSRPFFC